MKRLVIILLGVALGAGAWGQAVAPVATPLGAYTQSLQAPGRVATDAAGRLYVTDTQAGRVVVFDAVGRQLTALDGFQGPVGIAVDAQGRIYIGEQVTGSVSVFDARWNFLYQLGAGAGEFVLPNHIATTVTGAGTVVYVVDSPANRIKAYIGPVLVGGFGSTGAGDGQFNFPTGIFIGPAGVVYVVDQGNDRVEVFDSQANFSRAFPLKTGGGMSLGPSGRSQGVILDGAGRLYVADTFQGIVKVFDAASGLYLTGLGSYGEASGQLNAPGGLVLDSFNRLNVASANNGRVESFGVDAFQQPNPTPPMGTIAVMASPLAGGAVTGGGTFPVGSTNTITATPAHGWIFTGWSDGSTDASRAIIVPDGGGQYTANFQLMLGFALGAPNLAWSTGGDAAWEGPGSITHAGQVVAQSGAIGDNQISWFQTSTNGPGSLLFWWKVSSAGSDYLSFIVDTTTNRISGNVDWTQFACFVGEGTHTFRWEYAKDASGAAGSDAGWVGQVFWMPCPAATNAPQLFFKEPNGLVASWVLDGNGTFWFARVLGNVGGWQPKAAGDVDGDGTGDLIFQTPTGETALWFMNADGTIRSSLYLGNTGVWEVRACADYLAAGHANLFFQTPSGATAYWQTDTNGLFVSSVFLGNTGVWQLKAAADLDNDRQAELLWQLPGGLVAAWFHTNGVIRAQVLGATGVWELHGAMDSSTNSNGVLVWQTPAGDTAAWLVDTNGVPVSVINWGRAAPWKLKAASGR